MPLSYILGRIGALPQARYVVYRSIQPDWRDSIDMADESVKYINRLTLTDNLKPFGKGRGSAILGDGYAW